MKVVIKIVLLLLATPGIAWAQRQLDCPGPGCPGRNIPNIDDGPGGSMHGIGRPGGGGGGAY